MSAKFLCLFVLALPLTAAESWKLPLFTSDPRSVLAAAARYTPPEGSNAAVLDYSVQVQIDPTGKMTKTTRIITEVLRAQGIEGARRIASAWTPWREDRPKLRARVITADGQPHILDEAAIDETGPPNAPAAGDMKMLSAILRDVELDSVIEEEIEQKDREVVFPESRYGEVIASSPFPILHFQVEITASSSHPIRAEARGFADAPHIFSESMGQAQKVMAESSNIFPGQNGGLLPPETAPVPAIAFTNVPGWRSVAQWYAEMVSKAAIPQVATRPAASGDQVTTVEDLFESLRKKVHDNGVPLGVSPYAPLSPSETLEKGAGGSQDEAVLLIRNLNEAGITARAALISADPRPDVLRSLPGIEAFNRVLVYIPGEHPLWIDPAAEFTPVSRLPLADQGRLALVADPETTDLVRTPESTAAENLQINTEEIQLYDGSNATVTETIESHGAFADLLRPIAQAASSTDGVEKENAQTQLVRLAGAQRVTKIDPGQPGKLLLPCRIQTFAEGYPASHVSDEEGFIDLAGQVSTNFRRLAAALRIADENSGTMAGSPPRKFDYYVPPAFTEESKYHIVPPLGYRFKQAPNITGFTVGPLAFSATTKLEADGSLRITYGLVSPKGRYTSQDVAAMRRDVSKITGRTALRLVFFNVAEEKLANGELKDAIALLRQNASPAPSNSNAQLRLASAYVNVGARAEAVRLCQKLIDKSPSNSAAYARLGWIYTHDEFGRQSSSGMDMAASEKAYLKAIDLEPQPAYLLQLATLYTYNSAGIRFGNSARIEQALQLYRQIGLDILARTGAVNEYAKALLFARQYSDLRKLFLYPQADHADPAIKLAAIAAAGGAADVKEEAQYLFPDAAQRQVVLVEAARYLLNSREFGPAATLFDMAGGAGHGISAKDLAAVKKTRDFDESVASKHPAIAVFQRFICAIFNPPDPDAWKKLVVLDARDLSVPGLRLTLLQLLNGNQEALPSASAGPFVADVLATSLDFSADGNEQTGFRIRIPDPARKATLKTVGYVVKRGSEYLLLGLTGVAASSGEALAKAQSGDQVSARQWLDWAIEEVGPLKTADPMSGFAFQRLWPPKSTPAPELVKAAAASLAVLGTVIKKPSRR